MDKQVRGYKKKERGTRKGTDPLTSSPDTSKQQKKRLRAEEDEYTLARHSSAFDEVNEKKKIETINGPGNSNPFKKPKTDHFNPETPKKSGLLPYPSSSSPDFSTKQKSEKGRRLDLLEQPLIFDNDDEEGCETASPDILLIKHLKQLSKMEPILNRTDSIVYELLVSASADSKFTDAWKGAGRVMKQLKEGLKTNTEVLKLLCSTYAEDDSTISEDEE